MPIPTGPDGSISWTNSEGFDTSADNFNVNSGPDDLLEAGVDFFGAATITYTGYVVEFGGQTFAIFGRPNSVTGGADYHIPYNPADGIDLAPLLRAPANRCLTLKRAVRRFRPKAPHNRFEGCSKDV